MKLPIYLDHHATTPVDPRVLEAMLPFFTTRFGNPASAHAFGWDAEEAVTTARAEVAKLIGANPDEITFTSGATESNNLALKGVLAALRKRGRQHLVVSAIEHPAILDVARHLEREGAELTVVPVQANGIVDPAAVAAALRDDTALVSVMAANNEIGTIQPIQEIARLAHQRGALFHTDAAQAVAKIALDVHVLEVDLLSLSAHKMYGPKGIGALFVRRRKPRIRLVAQMDGGSQEGGRRSGTLAVPSIVGLGTASAIAREALAVESKRLAELRDHLLTGLRATIDDMTLNGDAEQRLPGNLNLSFRWIDGEALVSALRGIAVSSGSACTAADSKQPSHVLRAIGLSPELAHAALRFGIGRFNTMEEIDETIAEVTKVVSRLRAISPMKELQSDPRWNDDAPQS